MSSSRGLTDVEMRVLRGAAEGNTTQSIAAAMGLSPWTVSTHIRRIHRALGARDRANLVHLAHLQGLLDATETKPDERSTP